MAEPAPERPCGDCSACCTHMTIDTPTFAKVAGVACEHCLSPGCGIYETRFAICRDYRCGWKHAGWLPEAMRPDRSGVIIDFSEPASGDHALEARLLAYRDPADFERNPVPDVISSLIEQKVLVHIALPGRPGTPGAKAAVNGGLAEAIRKRDLDLFFAGLKAGVRSLQQSLR